MKLIHILGVLPFIGMLGLLPLINQVTPFMLGMPFILFWFVLWVVLTSVILAIIFRIDPANQEGDQS
ncbi:DUF3311 domain-containing protein [Brevibacillus fluminis]|uniref:DUF3311 domain-containing protein n=1 Tax=Brevibacillus fluminis TaxID=511487 RepID=A0A3M8D8X6_9BACL|nr:DUF3311 domain-containing protein [Brevibacillus fluminis]RNB84476.1 DUF3311 domain-containing protein [Brevibacillus fluminis]